MYRDLKSSSSILWDIALSWYIVPQYEHTHTYILCMASHKTCVELRIQVFVVVA